METDHTDVKPYVLASPAPRQRKQMLYEAVLIGYDPPVKGSIACAARLSPRTVDLPSKTGAPGFEHSGSRHAKTKAEAMRAILAELARRTHAS